MNRFRFSISFPTYTIQNILNATLYFRLKTLSLKINLRGFSVTYRVIIAIMRRLARKSKILPTIYPLKYPIVGYLYVCLRCAGLAMSLKA